MSTSTERATKVASAPIAMQRGLTGRSTEPYGVLLVRSADGAGRGVLTLGQSVNLVVEEDDLHVEVAADHVQEVVAADRERVAVTRDDPHLHVGPAELDAGRDGGGTAVNPVEAVRVHVVGEAARAADARHEDELFLRDTESGQDFFHLRQDRIVPAARAPANLLIARKVLGRQLWEFNAHDFPFSKWDRMASATSLMRKGLPCTLFSPWTSTRN